MERETKKSLNIEQIQQIIPHRHPFCLIDRIEDYEPGEFAIGYKAVTYTEEFFNFKILSTISGTFILL